MVGLFICIEPATRFATFGTFVNDSGRSVFHGHVRTFLNKVRDGLAVPNGCKTATLKPSLQIQGELQ